MDVVTSFGHTSRMKMKKKKRTLRDRDEDAVEKDGTVCGSEEEGSVSMLYINFPPRDICL